MDETKIFTDLLVQAPVVGLIAAGIWFAQKQAQATRSEVRKSEDEHVRELLTLTRGCEDRLDAIAQRHEKRLEELGEQYRQEVVATRAMLDQSTRQMGQSEVTHRETMVVLRELRAVIEERRPPEGGARSGPG